MIPQASRAALRATAPRTLLRTTAPRRLASSKAPADRPRSWKSFALRWGIAIGGVYYYNTSPYFQDVVLDPLPAKSSTPIDAEHAPTLEDLAATRRARLAAAKAGRDDPAPPQSAAAPSGPAELEQEASQQGAFNEETGEINWECPCLGGMAHGPCGPEFREAFSCFVYSKEEPKGIECIEKFKGMQDCFRKYPDIYGAELTDDEPTESEGEGEGEARALEEVEGAPVGGAIAGVGDALATTAEAVGAGIVDKAKAAKEQVKAQFSGGEKRG